MSAPSVYAAINAVSAVFARSGIAKTHLNTVDDYKYRSIDDLLDRLAPLLAKHRLCVLPRVVRRSVTDRKDEANHLLIHVALRMKFKLVSVDDGSSISVEAFGEALDVSDKATAKAMSAAYKSAMVQTFCIPVSGTEDPDRASPKITASAHLPPPVQGWEQWAKEIEDIVGVCESDQAITTVQERHRELLSSLSRERHDLYAQLGETFVARRQALQARVAAAQPPAKRRSTRAKPRADSAPRERETEDA